MLPVSQRQITYLVATDIDPTDGPARCV